MNNISRFTINQSLHGYSNGHSLLATSLPLSQVDERRMLLLSDMSGTSMTKGFEAYITGYRLVKEPIYVLAKTWYATEMERPGCVWTHSLLINFNDLLLISKPQSLITLFSRPENEKSRIEYSQKIPVPNSIIDPKPFQVEQFLFEEYKNTAYFLYNNPTKQVFLSAENASKYQEMILKLWEFQGANLRRKFTFCTGSIGNRSSLDLSFDIQVVPEKNFYKIEKENRNELFIQPGKENQQNYPDWVDILISQLRHRDISDLRYFLNEWDSDIQNSRGAYSKLLRVYAQYAQDNFKAYSDAEKIIELISQGFPNKDEAVKLKNFLIEDNLKENYWRQQEKDLLLLALCTTDNYNSFDSKTLKLDEKAKTFLIKRGLGETEKILAKILASSPNPLGEAFIIGIAQSIDESTIPSIAKNNETLLRIFLYNNPMLCLNPITWDALEDKQKERLDVLLSSPKFTPAIFEKIIRYFLDDAKTPLASKLFNYSASPAVNITLNWIDLHITDKHFELGKEWRDQLSYHPNMVTDWMSTLEKNNSPKIQTLVFIARMLNPASEDVVECISNLWITQPKLDLLQLSEYELIEYSTFLLSVALSSKVHYSGDIVVNTFLIVHNAARDGNLPYESWQRISGKLPDLPWYQSWDKCERLRQGLIYFYINGKIKTQDFIKATNQKDVFEQIIQYSLDHKHIRSFIKNEITKNRLESINLSEVQQKILKKYL